MVIQIISKYCYQTIKSDVITARIVTRKKKSNVLQEQWMKNHTQIDKRHFLFPTQLRIQFKLISVVFISKNFIEYNIQKLQKFNYYSVTKKNSDFQNIRWST